VAVSCIGCGNEFWTQLCQKRKFCTRGCCFAYETAKTQRLKQARKAAIAAARLKSCVICASISANKTCSDECRKEVARRRTRDRDAIERSLLPTHVDKQCKQCGCKFTIPRTRGCGSSTLCSPCSKANQRRFKRDRSNHRRRARKAGVPYFTVTRKEVISLYGRRCWICKKNISSHPADPSQAFSLDHVVPFALGGWHHISNIRPAHHRCNSIKSDTFSGQLMLRTESALSPLGC
jgi:hypothetical protein